jgi:hypothetical protein
MKRIIVLLILSVLLTGCGSSGNSMNQALRVRTRINESKGCTFDLRITADYVDYFYEFKLQCGMDINGSIMFSVLEPDSISGIKGKLSAGKGELVFDEKVLVFPMMADSVVSPVSAPYLMINALRSGYIKGVEVLPEGMLLQIDDSFEGENMQINVTVDANNLPVAADVFWQGSRMIAMIVENFRIM